MTGSRPEQPSRDRQIDRDGEHEEPLRRVEAGPQRHSESFEDMARRIAHSLPPSDFGSHRAIMAFAAALGAVDRAAREECARIADYGVHWSPPLTPPYERLAREATFLVSRAILATIKD